MAKAKVGFFSIFVQLRDSKTKILLVASVHVNINIFDYEDKLNVNLF